MRALFEQRLQSVRRVVVKVGTQLLRGDAGGLNLEVIDQLCRQIATIRERGLEVILVSSGAVGAGAQAMRMEQLPEDISARQALAAVGQSRLMHHYEQKLQGYGVKVAQVLLTRDGLDHRQRYLNARNTLETLLKWNVLPIVNENDTVAIEELRFGDNDRLSAMIATKMDADLLVILTDVDGLFDRPPSKQGARRIPVVSRISDVKAWVDDDAGGAFSLGGMSSKLEAAELATRAGILTHVGNGHGAEILLRVLDGEAVGTWFEPQQRKLSGRKRWIAFGKRLCDGRIAVDEGAQRALRERGKSLLPSGVTKVDGFFQEGDLVQVCGPDDREIARGLVQYTVDELEKIKGKKTQEIPAFLGQRHSYEVIHRDDMVVLEEQVDHEQLECNEG